MKKPAPPLSQKLLQRKQEGHLRSLKVPEALTDFTSNDYLGLAREPLLKENIAKAFQKIKENGSTGSRLLTGNRNYHAEAEEFLAAHFQVPELLSFPSGYMANLALFSALPQRGSIVLYDEYIHACIKDGVRLSFAEKKAFRHNDIHDLKRLLERHQTQTCYVAVESIYSMQGDIAPLAEMAELCNRYGAWLIVDEAHSTGVMGAYGKGACYEAGITDQCLAVVYTFGKGMGVHGAALACSAELKDYLINFSRPFIYTTATDAHTLTGMQESIKLLGEQVWRIDELNANIHYFRRQMSLKTGMQSPNQHAIQAISLPGAHVVKQASTFLQSQGFDVRAIVSPTVPAGKECLRVVIHHFQTRDEMDALIDALGKIPDFKPS
jgi:8-amino-7-oxononanoate synthase